MKIQSIQLFAIAMTLAAVGTYCQADKTGRPSRAQPQDRESCGGVPSYGQQVKFAVIGDYGQAGSNEEDVADLIKVKNVDFIATLGDNNYPDGKASTLDKNVGQYYSNYIGCYKGVYGDGSSTNRFWPTPGNHDWRADGLGPYRDYFTLPGNEFYYDIELGPVHLFMVDSQHPDDEQKAWLQAKLQNSTACHRLVLFHHAAYSSGDHGSDEDMQWPFEEWGATAVIAGHDHIYERLQIGNIPYFVNGLGGRSRYDLGSTASGSIVRYRDEYGAMFVTVDGSEITYEFIDIAGDEIDSFSESISGCGDDGGSNSDGAGTDDGGTDDGGTDDGGTADGGADDGGADDGGADDGGADDGGGGDGGADGSCENACGEKSGDCWCDELCTDYQDCCSDYETQCPVTEGSCENACGLQSGDCWCDDLCTGYEDCCSDYETHCE